MTWFNSGKNRSIVLFTFAAFALRFILLVQYANQNPFYVHPVVDSALYLNWADTINSGKIFFEHEYHHPPGYAFFLAGILRATGGNLFGVLLLQILMMTALGLLIFFITDEMLGRASAWISCILFTLCGPITFYSMKILSEPLYMFLLFGSFYFMWKYKQAVGLSELFAGGVLLGAAAEVRGNALICVVPAVTAILRSRQRLRGSRDVVKHFLIFSAGILLFVAPVLLRNEIKAHVLSPVSSNWGENLYFGNHRDATGSFSSAEGFGTTLEGQIRSAQTEASRRSGRQLSSQEAQRYWANEAFEYMRNDPVDWLKLEVRKILKLFSANEASSIYYYSLEVEYFLPSLKWLFVDHAWIIPLFFLGLLSIAELSNFGLLLGYLAAQVVALLIFWPELRFLIPLFPFAFVVIGGIAKITPAVLKRKGRVAVTASGLCLWIGANFLWNQTVYGKEAWFANAASAYYAGGRNQESEAMAREAIKINPRYADAWVNLGAALYAENRPEEAKQAWATALRFAPDHLMALRNLALAVEDENPQQSLQLWQRALAAARSQHASKEIISAIEAQIHRLL